MIIVHHLDYSRSHRIIWLLEELGLPYEVVLYNRDRKSKLAPSSLKKVSPLGSAPVIQDGDMIIAESAVNIEYILAKYGNGRLIPKTGTKEWVNYLYYLHFTEGSFMPILSVRTVFFMLTNQSPFFLRPIIRALWGQLNKAYIGPRMKAMFELMETQLSKNKWIAGDEFTGADIQLAIAFTLSDLHLSDCSDKPHILDYIKRIEARPAYIKMLEIAGPVNFKKWAQEVDAG